MTCSVFPHALICSKRIINRGDIPRYCFHLAHVYTFLNQSSVIHSERLVNKSLSLAWWCTQHKLLFQNTMEWMEACFHHRKINYWLFISQFWSFFEFISHNKDSLNCDIYIITKFKKKSELWDINTELSSSSEFTSCSFELISHNSSFSWNSEFT